MLLAPFPLCRVPHSWCFFGGTLIDEDGICRTLPTWGKSEVRLPRIGGNKEERIPART